MPCSRNCLLENKCSNKRDARQSKWCDQTPAIWNIPPRQNKHKKKQTKKSYTTSKIEKRRWIANVDCSIFWNRKFSFNWFAWWSGWGQPKTRRLLYMRTAPGEKSASHIDWNEDETGKSMHATKKTLSPKFPHQTQTKRSEFNVTWMHEGRCSTWVNETLQLKCDMSGTDETKIRLQPENSNFRQFDEQKPWFSHVSCAIRLDSLLRLAPFNQKIVIHNNICNKVNRMEWMQNRM